METQNTFLCTRNIFVFCKMFDYDYINDCDKEIELFEITFHRPILFVICIFAIILSMISVLNYLTKFVKNARGKIEYTILFLFVTLWFMLLLADRCLIYYIALPGKLIIFAETIVKVLLSFSLLNCSLIDYFNHKVKTKHYIIKPLLVYLVAGVFVALLIGSYFASNIFFEIIYLVGVYLPIIASVILYFISSIKANTSKICLVLFLCIATFLFGI